MIWLIWYESYQFNHFFEKKSESSTSLNFVLNRFREQILSDSTQITVKEVPRLQFQMIEKLTERTLNCKKVKKYDSFLWLITWSKIEIRSQCHFKM